MQAYPLEKREPAIVMILSLFTCGIYLFFWYYKIYQELTTVGGRTPTGNSYVFDLLLVLVTCGIWGIYVDYRIALHLTEIQRGRGMAPSDTATLVVLLDVAAVLTGFITYFVTSAILQDELNRIIDSITANPSPAVTQDAGPSGPQPGNPYAP